MCILRAERYADFTVAGLVMLLQLWVCSTKSIPREIYARKIYARKAYGKMYERMCKVLG